MNKETAEIIKSLLDEFVIREETLKDLLRDKEKVIRELKEKVN